MEHDLAPSRQEWLDRELSAAYAHEASVRRITERISTAPAPLDLAARINLVKAECLVRFTAEGADSGVERMMDELLDFMRVAELLGPNVGASQTRGEDD